MSDLILPRRGFLLSVAAAIAAPAVIRFAPLMRISTRHAPLYVPINWLADTSFEDIATGAALRRFDKHGWPRPLGENWINLRDFEPDYVLAWAKAQAAWLDDLEPLPLNLPVQLSTMSIEAREYGTGEREPPWDDFDDDEDGGPMHELRDEA
jgi:hypothetical protein